VSPARLDDRLIEAFGLSGEASKPLRTLSGGTRQKVNAVMAFLFDPDLLILDEPTAGLDPVASGILKARIAEDRDGGKTFILTRIS
jgi:Cu-processing system ATP-binding protein